MRCNNPQLSLHPTLHTQYFPALLLSFLIAPQNAALADQRIEHLLICLGPFAWAERRHIFIHSSARHHGRQKSACFWPSCHAQMMVAK
jgi:hypothetical protein